MAKVMVERALNAELDDHPGYDKHEIPSNRNSSTSRPYALKMASFNWIHPEIPKVLFRLNWLKKTNQLYVYGRQYSISLRLGHDHREIVRTFNELYGADASPSLIPKVTDSVIKWQSHLLDAAYPIAYPNCIALTFIKISRPSTSSFI